MSIREKISSSGPVARIGMVFGVVVVVIGGAVFLRQPEPIVAVSDIAAPPASINTVQGSRPVDQEMNADLATADQRRIDEARETGQSALPTVRLEAMADSDLSEIEPEPMSGAVVPPIQAPVPRPVAIAPAVPVQTFAPAPRPVEPPREAGPNVAAMAEAMREFEPRVYGVAQVAQWADPTTFAPAAAPERPAPSYAAPVARPPVGPAAGTVVYAQMISGANSDTPGPVLAQIVQGKYAGAKVIGGFTAGRDKLVVEFTSMTFEREVFGERRTETIPISAYAVDSSTVAPGVATSVNRHILPNVGFAFAAAFAEGFSDVLRDTGGSVVANDAGLVVSRPTLSAEDQLLAAGGQAVGAAGRNLNQLFGNRAPTIKIASGTPVGVLFLP